jgi:GAF domain-containing protein
MPFDLETAPASLAERYRVLLGIGSTLAGVLTEEEIYSVVHQEATRVLEADGFYVVLYDGGMDEAEVVYWADRGHGRHSSIRFRGSDSEVLRTGRPVLVSDRLAARSLLTLGEDHATPTRSAISAPLHKGSEVVGCLSVQSYRPRAYGDAELELLQGVADVASVAIVNVRHLVELDRRKREAERMLEIARTLVASLDDREVLRGIVDAALELLESDGSTVWLLEEAGARVGASGGTVAPSEGALFPLEGDVVRLIVEERESLILEDIPSSKLLPPRFVDASGRRAACSSPWWPGTGSSVPSRWDPPRSASSPPMKRGCCSAWPGTRRSPSRTPASMRGSGRCR